MQPLSRASHFRPPTLVLGRCHRVQHIPRGRRSLWKSHPTEPPIRYQVVRFQKPSFSSRSRAFKIAFYSVLIGTNLWLLGRYLDIEIELEVADEETAKQGHWHGGLGEASVGNEQDEDGPSIPDEDSFFIPLTWPKEAPRTFYKGSDPEWQEFVRVARDNPRSRRIQQELLDIVYTTCKQQPGIQQRLGNDIKVGKFWLEVVFPDSPPPEYEQTGIVVGKDYIALAGQRVSHEHYSRLMRVLWPDSTASATWTTIKVLASVQYERLKEALGGDADPLSVERQYRRHREAHGKLPRAGDGEGGESSTSPGTIAASSSVPTQTTDPDPDQIPWVVSMPRPENNKIVTIDMPIAVHTFSAALGKNRALRETFVPPRGSFGVYGLVEVRGTTGRILFDVSSAYDPRQAKYIAMYAGVRNIKRWKQAPRGGP